MAHRENKFLYDLRDICIRLSKGERNLEKDLDKMTKVGSFPKVITDLAESFGMMLVQIQGREFELEEKIEELKRIREDLKKENKQLRESVQTLQIHIDPQKKDRAISAIEKSQFFKNIKRKRR